MSFHNGAKEQKNRKKQQRNSEKITSKLFFSKKNEEKFARFKKSPYLCTRKSEMKSKISASVAQLVRAPDC